jgi:hypothetical protein
MDENENSSTFEEPEKPFISGDRPLIASPKRHGCVTAWLVMTLVMSSIANKPIHMPKVSVVTAYCFAILAVLNIIFSIQLLHYKKSGFYGFAVTTILGFIINISIGISPIAPFLGLTSIAVLYAILQIKRNGISAWTYFK